VEVLIESPHLNRKYRNDAKLTRSRLVGMVRNDLSAELGVPEITATQACSARSIPHWPRALKPEASSDWRRRGHSLVGELIGRGAAPLLMTGVDMDLFLDIAQERVIRALAALG